MATLLIFFALCTAGVVFLCWFLVALSKTNSHSPERADPLSGVRLAVERLSKDVQLMSNQLGTVRPMRQIAAEEKREWWESEAHYLERRLTQLEKMVAELKKQAIAKRALRQQINKVNR